LCSFAHGSHADFFEFASSVVMCVS
jgi:hypothetical protein